MAQFSPNAASRLLAVAGAVLARPSLWASAARAVVRFCPNGWWRSWPFLPIPSREYLGFRFQTQYGNAAQQVSPSTLASDVVAYLRWCRDIDRRR